MEPTSVPQAQQTGWIASIAQRINIDAFLSRFNLSTEQLIELFAYAGGGFVVGFLFKRYFKFLVVALIAFFFALKGMEYAGIGTMIFNWDRVRELTGFGPNDTLESVVKSQLLWIQFHIGQTISFIIGFLLGMKVG